MPAMPDGPFDFAEAARRHRRDGAVPRFPADASVRVELCATPPKNVGPKLKGREVVRVTFPMAETVRGVRVFDYVVRVLRDGREILRSVVLAPGFHLPERLSHLAGEAFFGRDELPADGTVRFAVTPRDFYGTEGATLTSADWQGCVRARLSAYAAFYGIMPT